MFLGLRGAALAFDRRLRRGVSDAEVEQLRGLLDRLAANVGNRLDGGAPWAGLVRR
jgi:hypothetical protein